MPSTASPISVRLNKKTRDGVVRLAELTNRSRSYIINQAVEAYLDERGAYLQDLTQAVESIKTEPTYAADDVFSWMHSWGTPERQTFSEAVLPCKKHK